MRILHVIPQFPYFGGDTIIGGYSTAVLGLARAQALAGDTVTILGYVKDPGGRGQIQPGLEVVSLFESADPGTVRFGLDFIRGAAKWASPRRDDFDIIHNHSGFPDYFLASKQVQRKTKLPCLHTLYCPIPKEGSRYNRPFIRRVLRRAAGRLDGLLAMSQNVANSMHAWGLEGVRTVPPPVDLDRFKDGEDRDEVRASLGISGNEPVVLFVGNATEQKNLTGVLEAFAMLLERAPDARLIMTTELPRTSSDAALQALRDLMASLDIEDRVIQRGIVDNMPGLMRACDVLVAPFKDSYGPSDYFMVVLEAMATGRPTVVSNVGGMSEVLDEDRGRLVDPHSAHSIAEGLVEFVLDADLRRTAGASARRFAESTFQASTIADVHRVIYEETVA
ncbi:MAG: glycosyltransferase family 4 protein [Phycisphaerales bacterium]|nr:glycosyltransferase family 4 protein [Phycisphaerales bacterium]